MRAQSVYIKKRVHNMWLGNGFARSFQKTRVTRHTPKIERSEQSRTFRLQQQQATIEIIFRG